ncbi:MAG: CoA transferase [Pseudomonadales bacterium]|uniref:Formyl-CoA transferase n=1 Tax=marine metagenome TaxID=408172 RepID=A0A381TDR6_9ZZZZ|nr:CoA transferase [Pseudomonadales bacterium]MEC9252887.1 CoA transferase [Pseudomonadota bacterium]MEE3134029.1 CoA transferase [Pseudomonadota bacterium]|tara:strand:- start:3253 stop:4434 length:1182 start_codon:yes stop_codon:yes gene_type:complete
MGALPLSGYKVLDLTIARAGPTAVRLLADWGADVIKIEPPARAGSITGNRRGPDEQNLHRNKRGLCIDLKNEAGHALFLDLAKQADVIAENFRADVKHRLQIDYESVRAVNERVIYASISGFGQEGPYRDRPGVDQIVQGMSGLMSITGEPGRGPMRVGIAISDTAAGMFLGQGILLALLDRERTGKGQWVHTSLLESMLSKLDFQGARYTMLGDVPAQQGNDHPTAFPMGTFTCADGFVNIAAPTERMWASFLDAVEDDDLRHREEYASARDRIHHKQQLKVDMESAIASFSTHELVEKLNDAGVPCGPINDIKEGFDNPQTEFLRMQVPAPHADLGDVQLIRSPINLSRHAHPEAFHHAAPDPGEHSRDVLASFEIDEARIKSLVEEGAIA